MDNFLWRLPVYAAALWWGSLTTIGFLVVPLLFVFILLGLLLALLVEFAVAPRIVTRTNLKLWHSVGSVMYLVQWLCAAIVFWRITPKQ